MGQQETQKTNNEQKQRDVKHKQNNKNNIQNKLNYI